MFEHILAGTDGSDTARLAVEHAVELARALQARLTVVSAYAAPGGRHRDAYASAPAAPVTPEPAIAHALLRDIEAAFGDRVELQTRAVAGAAATVLVDLAATGQFDLVVVGNRGMHHAARVAGGSVPDRVSHRSRSSVLIADTVGGRRPSYDRILVGTDGGPTAQRAVEVAAGLSEATGGALSVATVNDSEAQARSILRGVVARFPAAEGHPLRGGPAEALCELAESGRYDLVVVGNRGMAGARRFLGSVPDRVSHRAGTNVLIVSTTA